MPDRFLESGFDQRKTDMVILINSLKKGTYVAKAQGCMLDRRPTYAILTFVASQLTSQSGYANHLYMLYTVYKCPDLDPRADSRPGV